MRVVNVAPVDYRNIELVNKVENGATVDQEEELEEEEEEREEGAGGSNRLNNPIDW